SCWRTAGGLDCAVVSASRWTALAVIGGVVGVWACGGGDATTRGVPDAGGRTFGRLGVVLTAARDGSMTVGAVGRLLRYKGVDREGAQVLAGARDRDPSAPTSIGRCGIVDDEARLDDALATAPPDAAVQMLDAGDLLVRVAGQTVKLAPRYVPEIVPFVSGVVYASEAQSFEGSDATGGEAFIAAFGGQQVGRFVTPAGGPAAPRLLGDASGIEGGSDLVVSWSAETTGTRGAVSLVLAREGGQALRCHVADTGHYAVPAAALARFLDGARG